MGRQKSDDRMVPEGRRKASRAEASQQGKAVTVNKQAEQLGLFAGTAASPEGATPVRPSSPLDEKRSGVPKPATGKGKTLSPMTMAEIANETNLRTAFAKVVANRGAPGPDRQTIEQVREALDEWLPTLSRSLLDGISVPSALARMDIHVYRRTWWALSTVRAVCRGLTNEYGEDSSHCMRIGKEG